MVVRYRRELPGCGAKTHSDDDFVDQFRGVGTDDGAAEDLTSGPVGQQFHETLGFIHDKRFSMVIKRIGGGEVIDRGEIERWCFVCRTHYSHEEVEQPT